MTARIVAMRDTLEKDPVASRGGLAILAELERMELDQPLPSVRTIERVLERAGLTRAANQPSKAPGGPLPLPQVEIPGVWQQADWIHDRYLKGGIRFSSLQAADVGSRGLAVRQFTHRRMINALRFLCEDVWPNLSIPQGMQTDNAFTKTTHRFNIWTGWVRLLLMMGTEVIVSPPNTLGFTNFIESVNNLWQQRTIRRHRYRNLNEVKDATGLFVQWANTRRPILNPDTHATRYATELIDRHRTQLRWLPAGFDLNDHIDPDQVLRTPIARGLVTHLRYVNDQHQLRIGGVDWPLPKHLPAGALVIATINTQTGQLTVHYQGEPVTAYPYPIPQPVTDPIHPPPTTSLYL